MLKEMPGNLVLETERCRLRHVHLDDIPHIFDATRYPGFNDGMLWDPPISPADLLSPHQRSMEAWQDRKAYVFTAETHDGLTFIGRIAIRQQQHGIGNIGYWIHPRQQNRGYGKEITRRIIRFGFEELELERIEASHAVWNKASRKILEHVGMHFIANIPQSFKKEGKWVAEDKLAVTREEWLALQPERQKGHADGPA